jgi:hypothetical protein
MKRALQAIVVLAVGLLSGCALIQKGLEQITPEISVGVYRDGVGGVTIGVKLEKNKNVETTAPADESPVVEEPKKVEEK